MNTCQSSNLSGPVFIDAGLAGRARAPGRRVLGISSFPPKRESRGRRVLRLIPWTPASPTGQARGLKAHEEADNTLRVLDSFQISFYPIDISISLFASAADDKSPIHQFCAASVPPA
jgi:hypothetical protein